MGLDRAVARYLPHRPAPADTSGIERNLRLRDGRWRWHWDPEPLRASRSLPDFGPALRTRLAAAVHGLAIPTLLVRGAKSDVVTRAIADEFADLAPRARVVEVPRAAHMVAGDDNGPFTDAVAGFLEEIAGR